MRIAFLLKKLHPKIFFLAIIFLVISGMFLIYSVYISQSLSVIDINTINFIRDYGIGEDSGASCVKNMGINFYPNSKIFKLFSGFDAIKASVNEINNWVHSGCRVEQNRIQNTWITNLGFSKDKIKIIEYEYYTQDVGRVYLFLASGDKNKNFEKLIGFIFVSNGHWGPPWSRVVRNVIGANWFVIDPLIASGSDERGLGDEWYLIDMQSDIFKRVLAFPYTGGAGFYPYDISKTYTSQIIKQGIDLNNRPFIDIKFTEDYDCKIEAPLPAFNIFYGGGASCTSDKIGLQKYLGSSKTIIVHTARYVWYEGEKIFKLDANFSDITKKEIDDITTFPLRRKEFVDYANQKDNVDTQP